MKNIKTKILMTAMATIFSVSTTFAFSSQLEEEVIATNIDLPTQLMLLDITMPDHFNTMNKMIIFFYSCEEGDTLKSLAKELYGDEIYYLYLAAYNEIDCRSELEEGQVLQYKLVVDKELQISAKLAEEERVRLEEEERKRKEEEERKRKEEEERKRQEELARQKEQEEQQKISSRSSVNNNVSTSGGRLVGNCKITCYTPDPGENGGWSVTATGESLSANVWKAVAVDPSVIPLGSTVYIEGLGTFIAKDTGGAIKGNRIDLLVGSKSEAYSIGVQYRDVYVLN